MRILGLALSVALTAAQPTEPNAHPAVGTFPVGQRAARSLPERWPAVPAAGIRFCRFKAIDAREIARLLPVPPTPKEPDMTPHLVTWMVDLSLVAIAFNTTPRDPNDDDDEEEEDEEDEDQKDEPAVIREPDEDE
jgi:hypothetical protein